MLFVPPPLHNADTPTEFGLTAFVSHTDLTTGVHKPHGITPPELCFSVVVRGALIMFPCAQLRSLKL